MKKGYNQDWMVVVDQEELDPDIAKQTVVKYDPLNRTDSEGGFRIEDGKLKIDQDKVMRAHKTAVNRYPHDGVVKMIKLDHDHGKPVHSFGENGFKLFSLPSIESGEVTGMLGKNGLGKTLSSNILSGNIKPNLGLEEENVNWEDIQERFRGSELQTHFKQLKNSSVDKSVKTQSVVDIQDKYTGMEVKDLVDEDEIVRKLGLENLLNRDVENLSGGEVQRLGIARTVQKDSELNIFDEPNSFLDVEQRDQASRIIRSENTGKTIVIDHDLASLDLVSDHIHIFYGEPGGYGDISNKLTPRKGINQFLEGYLPSQNLRFRQNKIDYSKSKRSKVAFNDPVVSHTELKKSFDNEFSLSAGSGSLHKGEICGILGRNGLGKTVYIKMLAGAIEPDSGSVSNEDIDISYKAQRLQKSGSTVQKLLSGITNTDSTRFETRISEPLSIDHLYDRKVSELSGGELQRVAIAASLSRDADAYLLDEPSAFLDAESRVQTAKAIKRYARKTDSPIAVVDHDIMFLKFVSDRIRVFEGDPGEQGNALTPEQPDEAMNRFLTNIGSTFREDPDSGRPRPNKPGSQKDRQQKKDSSYYEAT